MITVFLCLTVGLVALLLIWEHRRVKADLRLEVRVLRWTVFALAAVAIALAGSQVLTALAILDLKAALSQLVSSTHTKQGSN